jgi:outer membrane beta-barrel protein
MRTVSTLTLLLALTAGPAALAQEVAPIPVQPAPREPQAPQSLQAPASESAQPPPAAATETRQPPADAPLAGEAEVLPVADRSRHQLINGAPLHNPNVAVHVMQRKVFRDQGRHELALYPAVVQLNGRFTEHAGTALHYTWHVRERLGLQLSTQYNWYSNESAFNLELIDKVREQARTASSLLLQWAVQGGVEATPLYGKFAFYDDLLAQFSVVISGGAGFGSTRALVRPEVMHQVDGGNFLVPARFGDTGYKFVGSVGGGVRVQIGQAFALRLEVRDLVYTARVDRVDGCNLADFNLLEQARSNNQPFATLPLSSTCRYQRFDGVDPQSRKNYREDIVLGRDLVREPSSDVLNNVSFFAGFSFLL